MTTKEVEQLLGLSKQALIYYENEGFIKPSRDTNNYRNYSDNDIETLRFIISLRAIDLSIEDIKLISQGKLSLRQAIDAKKEHIEHEKMEINKIEERIKQMVARKKVKVSFNSLLLDKWFKDDTLFFNGDHIVYNDIVMDLQKIQSIELSMCSYMRGLSFNPHGNNLEYHIDLDIHCTNDTYSFEIISNKGVLEMFHYFDKHSLNVYDPLRLKEVYHEYRTEFELNRHLDYQFKKWAKKYNLDNPREIKMINDIKERYKNAEPLIELSKNIFKRK